MKRSLKRLDPEVLGVHLDRLLRAAWALCGSRDGAEDLVQETVVNVLRFFLQADSQSPAKRRSLVALSREVFGEYFKVRFTPGTTDNR